MSDAHVPEEVRARVRAQAGNRCGYCLAPQRLVLAPLKIDHIIPTCRGGGDDEENLWLAYPMCNGHKSARITALDPEEQVSEFAFLTHAGSAGPSTSPGRKTGSNCSAKCPVGVPP